MIRAVETKPFKPLSKARIEKMVEEFNKKSEGKTSESTVILFGSAKDPEVKKSINHVAVIGRKTNLIARPSFDSGTGPCGKHLCSCKGPCINMEKYNILEKKFG